MQIILNQNEIQSAMEGYLNQMLNLSSNKQFGIEFQTTRNPSGVTATVTIEDASVVVEPAMPATTPAKIEEPIKHEQVAKALPSAPVEPEPAVVKKKFFENL